MAGKNSQGQDIHPTYLEDPYFKTREAAQRYSDWKDRISPPSDRTSGVPNLFITGYLHSNLNVAVAGDDIMINADGVSFYTKVVQKYTSVIFGLGGKFRQDYVPVLLQELKKQITERTKLSFI